MNWLSDSALERLREAAEIPDLGHTRYRFVEKLGQGGMGSVYRVEDTELNRQVALKVTRVADSNGGLRARLLREARVIAQLEHPGIVPIHDIGSLSDGHVFYTMKLVQGLRLDQHVVTLEALPERLRVFQKICEAVSFAHAHGVLHRDLKPQNIMVGPFGEVLVMDWGLSKLLHETAAEEHLAKVEGLAAEDSDGTAHNTVLGTPGFMAPEQARGSAVLDQRADIYSLGAILKFLLEDFSDRPPRALKAMISKAMAGKPEDRYPSARVLGDEVTHYLDGLPVSAYPESPLQRLWRWTVKNRVWVLLILSYMLMRTLLILWNRQ